MRQTVAHRVAVHAETRGQLGLGGQPVSGYIAAFGDILAQSRGYGLPDRCRRAVVTQNSQISAVTVGDVCYHMSSCIDIGAVVEMKDAIDQTSDRKGWMSLMAKAPQGRISVLLDEALTRPAFTWLRAPEIGSVMVRGRAGGTGAPFNLGEVTVTRCALKLTCGTVGHAYIQGRNKADAEAAALVDALMQTDAATAVRAAVLLPLETEQAARKAARAAKAAATKVDFFTMVRGED